MRSRTVVLAVSALLISGASGVSGCSAGAVSARANGAAAKPPVPGLIRATLLAPPAGPGILPPGTSVRAADVGPRAASARGVIFGLADQSDLFGMSYPVVSTDSGAEWRIDGPRFSYPAAQGPSVTDSIGAWGRDIAWAWGHGGNFVKVTADGGRSWWSADFPFGVYGTSWRQGRLQARVLGPQIAGGEFETFLYVSPDSGRTWQLLSRLGNVPY
jgi:hypothetical protein